MERVAAESGVAIDTVRYYQRLGLLGPPTRRGRRAVYSTAHVDRLAAIRRRGTPLDIARPGAGQPGSGAEPCHRTSCFSQPCAAASRGGLELQPERRGCLRPLFSIHAFPPDAHRCGGGVQYCTTFSIFKPVSYTHIRANETDS